MQLKQQYMKQWDRRIALDSEREHEKVLLREADLERNRMLGNCSRSPRAYSPRGNISARSPRESPPPSHNLYLQELESDPSKIGFAYGGLNPGRLRARGQLIEQHKVNYSIGVCGQYLLHVHLRHQAAPLPGSPFTLTVTPGPAHGPSTRIPPADLPFRGVFELVTEEGATTSTARCTCKTILHVRDKMGNLCDSGGADLTCGVIDSAVPVYTKVIDRGDGTYLLEWWSATSGEFQVFIKIRDLHVVGSPCTMLLTSGTPDIAKTEVISFPQKVDAGKVSKVRIKCKDMYENPALPGRDFKFGLSVTLLGEKDPTAWRQAKMIPLQQNVIGEELEMDFSCQGAGDHKAYIYALEGASTAKSRKSTGLGDVGPAASETSPSSSADAPVAKAAPSSPEAAGKKKGKQPTASELAGSRTLLPGCPFNLKVNPAAPSSAHSFIDGIMQNTHGIWEKMSEAALKASMESQDAKEEDDNTLQIGDTIRLRPEISDQFGNSTAAHEDTLLISIRHPSYGLEPLRCVPAAVAGGWQHDVRYELKRKGPHILHVTLDGIDIPGSPMEWYVKFRT